MENKETTRFDSAKARLLTFFRSHQVAPHDFALAGNYALMRFSKKIRDETILPPVPPILRVVINPGAVTQSLTSNIPLWVGYKLTLREYEFDTVLGVCTEHKINVLVHPGWPDLTNKDVDGLHFADTEYLLQSTNVSDFNKKQLARHLNRISELGREPTETEQEYMDAVARFDPYYTYSDDISVYRAGKAVEDNIKYLASILDNHQLLWDIVQKEKA